MCAKHARGDTAPGGVILDDGVVYAGHAFGGRDEAVYLGILVVEPRRHAPQLGDLTEVEAARLGVVTNLLAAGLRRVEGAEHVYSFVFGEGVPHLHVILTPRYPGTPEEYRGRGAVRLREWSGARRGHESEVRDVVARLRRFVEDSF